MSSPTSDAEVRAAVRDAPRLVVKIGSSSLTDPAGGLALERLHALVEAVAARVRRGGQAVVVSSGAVAAGLAPLRMTRRPSDLASVQAAASVGQSRLLRRYADAFAVHDLAVGQVLLTVEDVVRRAHYRNARTTLDRLLALGAVPVVNENDAVATRALRFGDNDRLSALVAHLVVADALVLLSDVDGLYDGPPARPGSRLVRSVPDPAAVPAAWLGPSAQAGVGTGGMRSKVEAARVASSAGVPVLLAGADDVDAVLTTAEVGTTFGVTGRRRGSRHLWLAHASEPRGRLSLDAGAVRAVVHGGRSLLAAGVTAVQGEFAAGDPVDLVGPDGVVVARGLVAFDAEDVPALLGRSTGQVAAERGEAWGRALVHRDGLALLSRGPAGAPAAAPTGT